jgi:hypothetical protein
VQQQPSSTPRDVNPLKLPADVKDVMEAAKTDIVPMSRALHADFDVGAEHAPTASDQPQAPAGTNNVSLRSLLANNMKLREWVKVMGAYVEAASRDGQADAARQRGRVSAKDMWNQVRLGIDGIVDILQAHFAAISGTFRIRGLRKHHEISRYSPDDIIDP